ncbi:MAG: molybdenum cofactor biosynthesis protein MoaE, partial [Pseudoclavibacter sp.]
MTVEIAAISAEPIDTAAHLAAVADPHAGATASFIGTVRDHDPEASGTVTTLDYSSHPDAERVLASIAGDLDREGARIAITHRIGTLDIGDHAIVAAVSTAHRAEAFEVCRELVERVKAELPIWKRQHTADGAT